MRSVKLLQHLRELAPLYRGFVFEFDVLCGARIAHAGPQHCIEELLGRGKQVALTRRTTSRASVITTAAEAAGAPRGLKAWSAGEFVFRGFSGDPLPGTAEVLPFLKTQRPLKVFELSSLAMPRRMSDLMKRAEPPLAVLEKSGAVRRVDNLDNADVCYWDVRDGEHLGELRDASLELCHAHNVPLLYASSGGFAADTLASSYADASADHSARTFRLMGGTTFGVDKLQGLTEGLGWAGDLACRDVLLVTDNLGDVAAGADHDIDVLLILSNQAEGQLRSLAEGARLEVQAAQKHLSASQRLAKDSPAMLGAAANPFTAVFKLPSLLAQATRQNVEHRARVKAEQEERAAGKQAQQTLLPPPPELGADGLELLERWCTAAKVPLPAAVVRAPQLLWDSESARAAPVPKRVQPVSRTQADADQSVGAHVSELSSSLDDRRQSQARLAHLRSSTEYVSIPRSSRSGLAARQKAAEATKGAIASARRSARAGVPVPPSVLDAKEGESLDDIFNKLK